MVSLVNPNSSLKGKPHWRRTQEVYAVLNTAPSDVTYDRLIEYVRVQTGKGCSRKLISKWKKTINGDQLLITSKVIQTDEDELPKDINKSPSFVVIASQAIETTLKTTLENKQVEAEKSQNDQFTFADENEPKSISDIVLESKFDSPENLIEKAEPKTKDSYCISEKVSQVAKNTWSYVAATAIVCGIVGSSWFFSKDNSKPVIAQPTTVESIQNASSNSDIPPIQNQEVQNRRVQNGIPRTFKISLTVTSPQDLKVKPGDEISLGQVLSDRTTERQRLLAQKKQLEISLKKLDLPIPELTQPKPIPALSKLPPVSYQQEEANIALKQQELAEAEKAIANQETKIKELEAIQSSEFTIQNELFSMRNQAVQSPNSNTSPSLLRQEILENVEGQSQNQYVQNKEQTDSKYLPFSIQRSSVNSNSIQNPKSKIQNQESANRSLINVIHHERVVLEKLIAVRDKAKLQVDIAKSKLITAKENRAHIEYQRYLEETKRAIALQQQQIELERQRSIRAAQIQEREYSKAQIETKIQEIDNAIAQISTVKAPYAGKIKKIKWATQSDHNLTVIVTLDVDDGSEKSTITSKQ